MGFRWFGQPKVFGGLFGLPGGQATLAALTLDLVNQGVLKAGYRLREAAGSTLVRNLAYTSGLGSEMLTNGSFASDTSWVKGTGWTIAAGVAHCDGSQAGNSDLALAARFNTTTDNAKTFQVTFTITNYVAGTLQPMVGNAVGTAVSANGTYTQEIVYEGSGTSFTLRANLDFEGDVDNVSARQSGFLDGIPTNVTLGIDTPLGVDEAADFNGNTSVIRIPTHTNLTGLTAQEWVFVANPDNAGEGNAANFFRWGGGNTRVGYQSAGTELFYLVNYDTTAALKVITTPAVGRKAYFFEHDPSNTPNARIRIGVNGAVTEPAGTNTNKAGTIVTPSASIYVGNNSGGTTGFDGYMDELYICVGLTDAMRQQITILSKT